jgi:hypothetical protein
MLLVLYWEEWAKKESEDAYKSKRVTIESLLDQAVYHIQMSDDLLYKRAFWQSRDLS